MGLQVTISQGASLCFSKVKEGPLDSLEQWQHLGPGNFQGSQHFHNWVLMMPHSAFLLVLKTEGGMGNAASVEQRRGSTKFLDCLARKMSSEVTVQSSRGAPGRDDVFK